MRAIKRSSWIVGGAVAVALAGPAHAAIMQHVVPGEDVGEETSISTPVHSDGRSYQIQIAEDHLTDLQDLELVGLGWHLAAGSSWPSSDLTWADFDITLAEAANDVDSMSNTFDDNMTNPVQVRSGAWTIAADAFPASDWGPVIEFDTDYLYEGGDLIIEIRHSGNGQATEFLDAVESDAAGGYSSISGLSYDASSAFFTETAVALTQVHAVPSPSAAVGLMIGLGLLGHRAFGRPARRG